MFREREKDSLSQFIQWLKTDAPESWEELLFIPQKDTLLKQSLSIHHSLLTLSLDEYEKWTASGGVLLARTIDGDYLGEKQGKTYFLPHSLVKEDIRIKPISFLTLLIAYENCRIPISAFFD